MKKEPVSSDSVKSTLPFCNAISRCHDRNDSTPNPEEYSLTPSLKEGTRYVLSGTLGGEPSEPLHTGSTAAFQHPKLVPSLKRREVKFHEKETQVKIAEGSFVKVKAWADIPLNVDPITVTGRFYVFENLAHPVILGTEIMHAMKLITDMEIGAVYVRRGERKIFLPCWHLSCFTKVNERNKIRRHESNVICKRR